MTFQEILYLTPLVKGGSESRKVKHFAKSNDKIKVVVEELRQKIRKNASTFQKKLQKICHVFNTRQEKKADVTPGLAF